MKRVEIGEDSVKIYWNVDKAFYLNELTIKSNNEGLSVNDDPLFRMRKNIGNLSSNSFTNGARDENFKWPFCI